MQGRSRVYQLIERTFGATAPEILDGTFAETFRDSLSEWVELHGDATPEGAWPELRVRDERDSHGHKTVLQVSSGFGDVAASRSSSLPGQALLSLLESIVRVERQAFRSALMLPSKAKARVSVRVVSYRQGLHAPQDWHHDPSVATRIHRPAYDSSLVIRLRGDADAGSDAVEAPSTDEPSCVLIAGQRIAGVIPFVVPAEHAVLDVPVGSDRLVVTSFLWADDVEVKSRCA
jgi:hypothetical protein